MNKEELKKALGHEKIDPRYYSLEGLLDRNFDDRFILEKPFTKWFVYYYERGEKHDIHVFTTEDEACKYLLETLVRDPLTRIH